MAYQPMPPIEILGIERIQLLHPLRKISIHGFDYQMVMIRHLAKAMHDKITPQANLRKNRQPGQAINMVEINGSLPVPSRGYVIECTGKL
jgi:hypothetical protein